MNPSAFVREVLELCRLRGAPENLPHSRPLLGALLLGGCAVDALAGAATGSEDAFAHALLGAGVVLVLCAIALAIRGLSNRYVQTATALLACGLVISLAQWPLAWLIGPLPPPGPDGRAAPMPPGASSLLLAMLGLLAWQILVFARIVAAAMDSTRPFALALVLTWFVVYWALDGVLFAA